MKHYILKLIKEKFADRYNLPDSTISMLKLSTPNSGKRLYNKVVFLVFKNKDDSPFLCVKTVRKIDDSETIYNGFNKLSLSHKLVKDSPFEEMFPEPLMVSKDDNGIAFSVETACRGVRPKANQLEKILSLYEKQQAFLFKKSFSYINDLDQYVENIIKKLNIVQSEENKLRKYYRVNIKTDQCIKVPKIPQHGDLTLDNIFIDNSGIHIFDCERFGFIDIAGFDFFHLLSRVFKNDLSKMAINYPSNYFDEMGNKLQLNKQLIFAYWLHELLIKKEILQEKLNFSFIINGYLSFS